MATGRATSSTQGWGCAAQRRAGVVVWIPLILVAPALSLPGGVAGTIAGIALLVVTAASAGYAVQRGWPLHPTAYVALGVLACCVVAGSFIDDGWLPTWVLLAIVAPSVLRGRVLFAALALAVAGVALAAWHLTDDATTVQVQSFVVALAGACTTSFMRLMETVEELHRTRDELAHVAVAEERDRFSRDLHDLLGHTLSVMVVKAQAVRRLARTDPDQVVAHAADIEDVGRQALGDVRRAVDALRSPCLADELENARRALTAAGVETTVLGEGLELPDDVDAAFAWVVREGTTNVLRHSAAAHCRIELADGGDLRVTVSDDGIGSPTVAGDGRSSGLDGLRRRLVATGGRLEVEPEVEGFRLTAVVPAGRGRGRR
jgi:two-component system sensor histidine kinase DesK